MIELIQGDSSDIFQFESKQLNNLDDSWIGTWNIKSELGGGIPLLSGSLIKNSDIFNDDDFTGEYARVTFKIFEGNDSDVIIFNDEVISGSDYIVSGILKDSNGNIKGNDYITLKLKGVFNPQIREMRVKTDNEGAFSATFNTGPTIKTPSNSFFIFQLMPGESEQLQVGDYVLSVEVQQKDGDVIIFRKEVMQEIFKIKKQGAI